MKYENIKKGDRIKIEADCVAIESARSRGVYVRHMSNGEPMYLTFNEMRALGVTVEERPISAGDAVITSGDPITLWRVEHIYRDTAWIVELSSGEHGTTVPISSLKRRAS